MGGVSLVNIETHTSQLMLQRDFSPLSLLFLSDRLNSYHHLLKSLPKLDPAGPSAWLTSQPVRRTAANRDDQERGRRLENRNLRSAASKQKQEENSRRWGKTLAAHKSA